MVERSIIRRSFESIQTLVAVAQSPHPANSRVFLRSMMEDLIFAKWLTKLDEKIADKYLLLRIASEISETIEAQENFLPQFYKLFDADEKRGAHSGRTTGDLEAPRAAFRAFCKAQGHGPWGPSVKKMATEADLLDEYGFFYFASSRSVHSSLHEMGRMMWHDFASKTTTISSTQLEPLNRALALVYGTWIYASLIDHARDRYTSQASMIDDDEFSVWLAVACAGPALNGSLPVLLHPHELRWPTGSVDAKLDG
ncbi:DUF5677 domain-containing protein [Amycolatopsis sp. WAC 01376]|uniref:DUF5677 domain-containing protein n=1 Tax=Amycolatopsis sp. WAC 01376 TaxID=2203195 RepID=UPI001F19513F|nr:DUF5677 domain-containing protein [Amycolatopsis sp. WAC 01376]